MKRVAFASVALLACACSSQPRVRDTSQPASAPRELELVEVFRGGDGRYPAYRIPALLATARGALLAFAEGRETLDDNAHNDLVLRRSFDGGRTWGELQVVAEAGPDSLNNPCVVELGGGERAGRVLLMYQRYPSGCGEGCVEPGDVGDRICRTFLIASEDAGATWSTPRELTRDVKRGAPVTSVACGPGIGIQKRRAPHAGRVIVPFNEGPPGSWKVYAALSDDSGATWRRGAVADDSSGKGVGNEVQLAELPDGSLLLDARSFHGARCRKLARSFDGGETWTSLVDEPELVDPSCMGSLIAFELDGEPLLLHSGAESASERSNGVLRASRDGGETWPFARSIYSGAFAYSSLAALDARTVGCLFERDGYGSITLARIPFEGRSR